MKKSLFTVIPLLLSFFLGQAHAETELRVLSHASFTLPKEALAQFEKAHQVKVSILKAGDAGETLNKLILTKANPIADVMYGVDNTLVEKAHHAGIIEADPAASHNPKLAYPLPYGVAAVDYGYVTLNYDKAWFTKNKLPLPKSLQELTLPAYKDLLVVENPATSSTGYAFLLANIAGMGEKQTFDWWAKMRANGVKVTKGWTEAYYTEFSHNGGSRPIVVSYGSSPAAEVFYAKTKLTESPTANLFLQGGVFRQIEGAMLIKGGKNPTLGKAFIAFLQSQPVQTGMQTDMWMYPAIKGTPIASVMRFAQMPRFVNNPSPATIGAKGQPWIRQWTQTVLR